MIRLFDSDEVESDEGEIVMEQDGCCWFVRRVDGVERSSHLGFIGRPSLVKAWCVSKGIGFSSVHSPISLATVRSGTYGD